jgi:hypothetical protein
MKKLAIQLMILVTFYFIKGQGEPWYGQLGYIHDSTKLSCAKRTFKYPGYIMGSFRPSRALANPGAPDFAIDQVDQAGGFGSADEWSIEFQIQDLVSPASCASGVTNKRNCSGISIVETVDQGHGEAYAIVVTHNEGIIFATLNRFGAVINKASWPYTYQSYNFKPSIRLSANGLYYYICGSGAGVTYVMKVNPNGTQVWGNFYNLPSGVSFEGRDLIE